jgi:release factor glutamine methyltransferase
MRVSDLPSPGNIPPADRDILIAHVLKRPRVWVFAHPEADLTTEQSAACMQALKRRADGEPIAYITGEREFYGQQFGVDRRVLIPRPSTEGLVDLVISLYKKSVQLEGDKWHNVPLDEGIVAAMYVRDALPPFVVDVGTGTGCIAVTLAVERPQLNVLASDVSSDALDVARANADRHGVRDRVRFVLADGPAVFADLTAPFFVVSNPPYIPDGTALQRDVAAFEPHAALFAGADGTDVLKPLIAAAMANSLCAGIALECRTEQVTAFAGA